MSELRYPSADMDLPPGEGPFSVEQLYDGFGNLRELRHAGEALWKLDEAEQGFRLRAETFANGVHTDYLYQDLDLNSCTGSEACIPGALRRQSTTNEASSDLIADISYTYNAAGQLDQRNRRMPGNVTVELFGYDAYRRLNSYVRNGLDGTEEMRGYAYTPGGDLNQVDVTTPLGATTEAYGYVDPDTSELTHQVTTFNDRSYGYDDNGNQTRRTVGTGASAIIQERLFDEFDMPQRIEHNEGMVPSITNFDYDAFQNRVAKRDSGQTTFYAGDAYECVGTTVEPSSAFECEEHRFKVYVGSRLIAQITQDPGGLEIERSYVHADHLGSSSLSTNENAEPESRIFLPFGETSADFTNTRLRSGFTGHEHDANIGLINMKGRLYDPELRKFISADPIVAVPLSPQSWNPYSYVMNDPLNATDPSGFQQSGGSSSGPQLGCCVVPPEGGSPIPYVITPNPPPPAPSVETRSPPSAGRGTPPPPPAPTPPPPATAPAESPPVAPPVVISLSLTAPAPPPSPRPQEHRGGEMGGSSGISGGAGHGGPSGGAGPSGYAPNVGQGSAMSGSSGTRSLSWSGLVLGAATPAGAGAYRVHANPPPPSVEEGMAVASMAPGVGEAIDIYVITAPDSSFWDRVFAGVSLGANMAMPFLPNFGAALKGAKTGVRNTDDLVKAAQKQFPGKAGRIEQHHITPKFLGGDPKGPTVPLDAAYHQQITNAFRELQPYGSPNPSPQRLQEIMQQVYEQFPLP